ncbi:MAG: Ig-like domain-containing protein [Treponema sp.]
MNRRIFMLICLSFLLLQPLIAKGKKDVETRTPETPESWSESFDISGRKRSKYNVLVTAEDLAGNIGTAGPFNMYIDPKSDLPVVHINNPVKNMCVNGNLNVSGTCFDDDAVAQVFVSLDNGEPISATGTQFWSCFFDTVSLAEGIHQVSAWGVDSNGVIGTPLSIQFHLNRQLPETKVSSIDAGALVSGKITLSGTVEDGNGVKQLFYSVNGGETYIPVSLKKNKKLKNASFKIPIDTRKMPEGPTIFWFKAIDMLDAEGISTFLCFIDNTPPSVDFSYPPANEVCGSIFAVGGSVVDSVSLEAVAWKMGKQTGSFELVKGNPYWVKEFDVSKSSNKTETIEIIAKDTAGNTTSVKRTIKIDKTKDQPIVAVALPAEGSIAQDSLYIAGTVENLSGSAEIRYQLDKEKEQTLPVPFGPFSLNLENIAAGTHTVSLYAVNAQGVKSKVQTIPFSATGKKPVISLEKTEGVLYKLLPGNKQPIGITIQSDAGIDTLSYTVDGGEEIAVPAKQGSHTAAIKIPAAAAFANKTTAIRVYAVDVFNRRVSQTFLAVGGTTAAETALVWAVGNTNDAGTVLLTGEQPLTGVYVSDSGAEIASAVLAESVSGLTVSQNGHTVSISGTADGLYENVQLAITDTQGNTFTTEAISILVDSAAPLITVDNPDEPQLITSAVELTGTVTDGTPLQSITYTIGTGSPLPLSAAFSATIPVEDVPDGLIVAGIHAVDSMGHKSSVYRLFYKDTTPPAASMLFPRETDAINGIILSAFTVTDAFPIVKAEYKPEGEETQWKPIEITPLIHTLIGSTEEPISKGMQFRFTDKAGNISTYTDFPLLIDTEADKPVLEIHLPVENQIITEDFTLSGIIYDDDGVSKVYYKIDDNPLKTMEVTNTFAIPFNLTDFTDNEHIISIYGEDIYGVKSNVMERKVRISLAVPEGAVTVPTLSDMIRDTITIEGTASDKNGIEKVEVSLDNGATYNAAEGTDSWQYLLNTRVIKDGTHVIFVKVRDNYGEETLISTLLNIDNTNPSLKLEYPTAGGRYDNTLLISGQIYDNLHLEGVTIKIKGLQDQAIPDDLAQMQLPNNLLVTKELDISGLAEGRYNLEITAVDKANNTTNVARNFEIVRNAQENKIALLYPLNGENVVGEWNVYGRITSATYPETVTLLIDEKESGSSPVSPTGYFSFRLTKDAIPEGQHQLAVKAAIVPNQPEISRSHTIFYKTTGPWVTIDNFAMGDFAIDRPYLRGNAGYSLSDEDAALLNDKATPKEIRALIAEKRVASVEISFNNGKTFIPLRSHGAWKYRLETGDMAESNHFILVKATMVNKETAVCRTIVSIDKTIPTIKLITPDEGGLYNEQLTYSGLVSDDVAVKNVELALRKGDKFLYSVPQAMRGLHFDMGFLGATLWNAGIGLSFFDSNVKLQLHYGQYLPVQWAKVSKAKNGEKMRYGGHVFTAKILANVFELPFANFAGPDWAWLYMTGSLGANFSIFTETQSKKTQILSAMLAQIEFPRVKLPKKKVKYCNTFAFYTEGQLWFIPTDVSNKGSNVKAGIKSIIPRISFGLRLSIF